jgi:hypothetical protein
MDVLVLLLDQLGAASGPAEAAAGGATVVGLVALVVVDRTVGRAIRAGRRVTIRAGKRLEVDVGDVVEAELPGPPPAAPGVPSDDGHGAPRRRS